MSTDTPQALPEIDGERLERLHARLVTKAAATGDLDVAYRTIDSPFGPLVLAATPEGLVRVGFVATEGEEAILSDLSRRVSPRVLLSPGRLDKAAQQVEEFLAGRRGGFEIALDLRLATGFRGEVVRALTRIGYGSTATYREVAGWVGNPGAVRAVGTACATNPLPLVLPCHRVVRSDGQVGDYRGGPQAKRTLLTLEGAC